MNQSDILIIGSGVAGLSLAIRLAKAREDLKICVLTKSDTSESNTKYAQGGVASVWNKITDSHEKHIADTLDAGDGLCDRNIVEIVVKEGPERVKELIEWGARFDRNNNEKYNLGKEGGHSENRILHYKDVTGAEIERTLIAETNALENINILEHYFALDLITQHHQGKIVTRLTPNTKGFGIYALNKKNNEIETFLAKKIVFATGGSGQIYKNTTNPIIATGDGIAMFYRAKGWIENMEFVQFHPTALFNPTGGTPDFLVSEAVRGFGAILKLKNGKEFMQNYDERGSLAPRDIVARAIDNEMKKSGEDCMWLDCRHLNQAKFLDHFPNIYEKCKSIGIDPFTAMIPVVPACHYVCGGIKVDEIGKTSIENVYACGEVTCTGLHGANRLASNSLLEAMVFAKRIGENIIDSIDHFELETHIPNWDAEGTTDPKELVLITQSLKELKEIMSVYVGIVRTNTRLKRANDRLRLLFLETEELYSKSKLSPQLGELRNLITNAYLVTKSAAMRRESRGLHYNTDYPEKNEYLEHSIL